MTNKVHFKTNILLKNIIGKDLITDDNVAMLELVKNSYDAGSKIVEIRFLNVARGEEDGQILICDRGCGMDYDGLINKWLNIAYSEKKENSKLNGRRQAGNKGVGRFSCDRLGKTLTIFTKMVGKPCFKLCIDWRVFEDEDAQFEEIQDITFDINEVADEEVMMLTGWNNYESGTILDIQLLRAKWTPEKIVRLRRDLEKFINPNSRFISDSFQITLRADEYRDYDASQGNVNQRVNGIVENKIFEQLDFRTSSITSSIDSEGRFIITSLQDRGREVFELRERNPYQHLRNVRMTVYYLNPYSKRYFRQQTGFSSADFGSIFLFINGFRIPPYGDQGDDWLGIEKRKSLGFRRFLSTREVVGRVEINDEDNDFMIISSRTGVVYNEAFWELSRSGSPYGFFFKGFRRLERFVVEGIAWDKTPERVTEDGNGEEKYLLDDLTRDKQILSVIRQIIDVDEAEIDSLHINEAFVSEIMNAQMEETASSIEKIVGQLSELTANASPDALHSYKHKLEEDSYELDRLMDLIGKLAPSNSNLHKLSEFREELFQTQKKLEFKQLQLDRERAAKEKAEREKEELEKRLALEKEKNTYLLTSSRSMSEDAKGMVHNIKIIANSLHAMISLQYKKLAAGMTSKEEQLNTLSQMLFQADKALKISKLITRANFKADSEDRLVNVPAYINQYLAIYGEIMSNSSVEIVNKVGNLEFERMISVLDISVIIDNLISNSQKAHANKVEFDAELTPDNELKITVSDNGDGLGEQFLSMPESIFELGVTSTDGSGIGLYTVKNSLEEIGGTIKFAGNGQTMKGASFIIIIP